MIDAAWVALSLTERIGGKTLRALMAHFNYDTQAILKADAASLKQVAGIGPKLVERIQAIRLEQVEQAISRWQAADVQIITSDNIFSYPHQLKMLDDAPPTLFVKGHWPPPAGQRVAVVGTRNPSPQAIDTTRRLGCDLAKRGCTIVSGLAYGVDAAAHSSALTIADSYPLAVLGCGVLNIYPAEHQGLAQSILRSGAIVSEVHPTATPSASNLVARNRIITGLADAVIVVETEVDGGAMHAARFAGIQGRPVYTFDFPASGNRSLLANGAGNLTTDLRDLPF